MSHLAEDLAEIFPFPGLDPEGFLQGLLGDFPLFAKVHGSILSGCAERNGSF
jgi:hypothetical protein